MHSSRLNGRAHAALENGMPLSGTPGDAYEDRFVSLQGDPVQILRRRLWSIVLVTVAVTGLAAAFSFMQTPRYEASIKILVGQEQTADAATDLSNEVQGLQGITETMVEAIRTRPVARGVIERMGLQITPETFQDNLSVDQIGTSQFVQVSYVDPDPERARQIANTLGGVFAEQVSRVSPSANAISASVWEQAVTPESPVSPNLVLNVVLALALGLILGVGLAFLADYMDDRWRSPEEMEQVSGVPTVGAIPAFKIQKRKGKRQGGPFTAQKAGAKGDEEE